MGSQIPLFNNFFIKNGSHGTIHTFKNYFATMFSVSTKISSIQADPQCLRIEELIKLGLCGVNKINDDGWHIYNGFRGNLFGTPSPCRRNYFGQSI